MTIFGSLKNSRAGSVRVVVRRAKTKAGERSVFLSCRRFLSSITRRNQLFLAHVRIPSPFNHHCCYSKNLKTATFFSWSVLYVGVLSLRLSPDCITMQARRRSAVESSSFRKPRQIELLFFIFFIFFFFFFFFFLFFVFTRSKICFCSAWYEQC